MASYDGATTLSIPHAIEAPRYASYGDGASSFQSRVQAGTYLDGYVAGEQYGFASPQETDMDPIKPGETDVNNKTISFRVYSASSYRPISNIVPTT